MRKCFEGEGRNHDKFITKPKIQSGARLKNFLTQFFSSPSCTDRFWAETFYYGKDTRNSSSGNEVAGA